MFKLLTYSEPGNRLPNALASAKFEDVAKIFFGLFMFGLTALLMVLYAGVPIPDSWP
jgi:hypothetical protein